MPKKPLLGGQKNWPIFSLGMYLQSSNAIVTGSHKSTNELERFAINFSFWLEPLPLWLSLALSGSLWLAFRLSLVPTASLCGTLAFKGTPHFILLERGPGTTIWSKLHLIDLQVGILRLDSMHPPISSSAKILENCPIVFRPAIIIGVCKLSV